MRILYVEGNTDGTVGGSYFCLLDLLRRLDRARVSPTVVFHREHPLLSEFAEVAETVVLPTRRGFSFADKLPRSAGLLVRPFQRVLNLLCIHLPCFFRYRHFARKRNIGLIHLNNGPSEPVWTLVARSLGIQLVAHLRGVPTKSGSPSWICAQCDHIVCVSEAIKQQLIDLYPSITNASTIYDGLELGVPRSKRACQDDFSIGIVANIKRWKGQDTALRALAELRDMSPRIKMLFIGGIAEIADDQLYAKELIALAQSLKLEERVTFTGFRNDVEELIANLDLLVLPSRAPEPFGRVLLEAMSLNVPVIATGHGGPTEIIENGVTGLLFPPGEHVALADTIRSLSQNGELGKKLSVAARNSLVTKFSPQVTADRFTALYEKLVNGEKTK